MNDLHARAVRTAPEIAPYLRAPANGLTVPRCETCGGLQWPPRPLCRICGGEQFRGATVPAEGLLYSWTTTHRAPDPDLATLVPFTVVIIELTGPQPLRMVGRLRETGTVPDLRIGEPLVAVVEPGPGGIDLVLWSRP